MIGVCHIGDCLDLMRAWPDAFVQTVVTSPPYWGLRDYRIEGQLGLEPTFGEYVERMVEVFREVRRLLKDDGTVWLNLGDGYADKNLLGIPWRVAFALQDDGWYLRQDIIWHKPNPMPESVKDRCTKAHEYLFLLSKSPRYYFDQEAVMEPVSGTANARGSGVNPKAKKVPAGRDTRPGAHRDLTGRYPRSKQNESFSAAVSGIVERRNKRSVWTIQTQAFPEAHFATFPVALVEPCVLAGSRPGDVVLDPFMGSGTVAAVAQRLGRQWIGCELNPEYVAMQARRTAQQSMAFDAVEVEIE